MIKIKTVFSLILIAMVSSLVGQSMTIKGNVIDAELSTPIEFATISIYDAENKTLVGGGVSELGGSFTIETSRISSYAVIEYLSYQSKRIDLKSDAKIIELGNVRLTPDAISLDGVEVIADRSTSQFLIDKKVFNVGSDLASKGGSAQDILENVPSITVDIEGNVALRGSNNVRILINGKPSGLIGISGSGGLRNIQANQIEKVEVITNPSARYDASGTAGIINIVLKKDDSKGFSGSFQVTGGAPFKLGAGANLNYRKGPVNFFINYGADRSNRPGSGRNYTEFFGTDSTLVTALDRTMDRVGFNQSVRAGLDIYLPKKQSLTASFSLAKENNDNNTTIVYRDETFSGKQTNRSAVENKTSYEQRLDIEKELENKIEYALDYKKDFGQKGHELTASLQYQNNEETENSDFTNRLFDNEIEQETSLVQRSNNAEKEKNFLFQVDYVKPIKKGTKLEFGARSNLRNINNDYKVETLEEEDWINEVGISNQFSYDEFINAAYISFGSKINKWSYQIGLRSEYSDIKTLLEETQEGYDSTYLNFFPSGFLSYSFNEANQLQASYSRRINRPGFWSLNPFFSFSDNRNFFSGNPFLRPEYTDSYEISYLKYFDQHSFNSSIYYRKTTDNRTRLKTVNPDGTSITMPFNIGLKDAIGMEYQLSLNPYKWLRLSAEANLFYVKFYGNDLPIDLRVEAFNYTARLNTKISMEDGTDIQVRTNYRGPADSPQGRRRAITSIDIGASRDFLNKNLTVTLNIRDLLNQRRWSYERFDNGFYEDGEFQWMRNSISLNVSYRINAKKERSRGGRGGYQGGQGQF